MAWIETGLPGVKIFEPKVFGDPRGYFFESYNARSAAEAGVEAVFVQDNQSSSTYGVLRGLHYQQPPFAQAKLVRVLSGAVLDVAVDIRKGSPGFGKWVAVELSAENKRQLFIPRGFAHGFAVLSETAEFFYKCDNFYSPQSEGGIHFDDPALGIDWKIPASAVKLSDKDVKNPLLSEARIDFVYGENS